MLIYLKKSLWLWRMLFSPIIHRHQQTNFSLHNICSCVIGECATVQSMGPEAPLQLQNHFCLRSFCRWPLVAPLIFVVLQEHCEKVADELPVFICLSCYFLLRSIAWSLPENEHDLPLQSGNLANRINQKNVVARDWYIRCSDVSNRAVHAICCRGGFVSAAVCGVWPRS